MSFLEAHVQSKPNASIKHKGKIDINVVPLRKLHLVAASHSYILAQDGLDTVQPISSGLVRAVHSNHIVTLG